MHRPPFLHPHLAGHLIRPVFEIMIPTIIMRIGARWRCVEYEAMRNGRAHRRGFSHAIADRACGSASFADSCRVREPKDILALHGTDFLIANGFGRSTT
jgi:hypothetical protein